MMDSVKSDFVRLFNEISKSSYPSELSLQIFKDSDDPATIVEFLNWINFARTYLSDANKFEAALTELNRCLTHRSFLVKDTVSCADVAVWARLQCCEEWEKILEAEDKIVDPEDRKFVHLKRMCDFVSAMEDCEEMGRGLRSNKIPLVKANVTPLSSKDAPKPAKATEKASAPSAKGQTAKDMKFEEGGIFEHLPDAEMGKVVVRFPPEASGYMHIGHAKAALLNHHYKEIFKGKLILRFDDTNPAKENEEFEKAILEDLPRLGVTWDELTFTSNHFDKMIELCTQMIKDGKAYADNTDSEIMRSQREARQESAFRNNSVEKNLAMWKEMQEGTPEGLQTCIRAKIDMSSDNGAMRDPTIFRCKVEPHIRTGTKYKVFPIYDFACPIADSLDGVTHALRTSEYNDRNEQYYWMCDALKIRKPRVIDFSRLALQSTLLSKRKLAWFVTENLVSGWDDARMPTVRGILRHGLTPEGLRQFVLAQGSSRSTGTMEWDKIWAFNKKVIDPIAPRYTGLNINAGGPVKVHVKGQKGDDLKQTPLHPKDPSVGEKTIVLAPVVLVEQADADCFVEGENVTFVNWGNIRINKLHRDPASTRVISVDAELNLQDTDYKKTQKVTWLADPSSVKKAGAELAQFTPVSCVTYGSLISKPVLGKSDDFKDYVNEDSVNVESYIGDPQLRNLKKGDIIQLQRKGFYICDSPYNPNSYATGKENPCVLFYIPDGATKARPTTGSKFKATAEAEETKVPVAKATGDQSTSLSPEEAAKLAEKQRLKEARKATRKAGREKAKAAGVAETAEPVVVATTKPPVQAAAPAKQEEKSAAAEKPKKEKPQQQPKKESSDGAAKKQTRLGLEVKKAEDTAEWYTQVITKSEMLEYYDVSGCYILRPWAYFIWTRIQSFLDSAFFALGVENAYFPLFVSKNALEQEKDHIADFAPEVAWVTRSGSSDLAEPIALRPTSETIMYPAFAKWIKSHRDLPLKVNQWSNVVRWEFKHPTPFLRTREFLWQEGHTAYAEKADAEAEVLQILDLYRDVYQNHLAIPCIRGRKTEREKFPGGDYTTTVEIYIGASGRAIQGGTSHHLGENFSRIFGVTFEDPTNPGGPPRNVQQNSWGLTTRTIGVMVLVHGDDRGLVLPPRVARFQVVVVPCGITAQTPPADKERLLATARRLYQCLSRDGIRAHLDDRDHVSPGWKFNHWELRGVPLRLEVGPKDLAANQVTVVLRYNGEKRTLKLDDESLCGEVWSLLDDIHGAMLERAREDQRTHVVAASNMKELRAALARKCLVLAPFCGQPACEDAIRTESTPSSEEVEPGAPAMGAKSLCVPFVGELEGLRTGPEALAPGTRCLGHPRCQAAAIAPTLFGRSY